MPNIDCITLNGRTKKIPWDRLILRPAAYALITHDDNVLLLKLRHTGKYHLPGGAIAIGERIEETLKRETREETGIEIEVERFAHFEEVFFYYDPSDRAYHGLHFYYICRPKTLELVADEQVDDGSAERPRWVEIRSLCAEAFQIHGNAILALIAQATDPDEQRVNKPMK